MTKEEKALDKFVNEPSYREKVIAKIHKEQDSQYEKRIKRLGSEKDKLISKRTKEIERVAKSRWESVADGKLLVNVTEGKVKINQNEFVFSDIQGAELNFQAVSRVVTDEKGTSKRNVSLGGAVLGGLINPVGAVIGGVGLGKKNTKGQTIQTEIPMCTHIGVLVNLNGFVSEIVLLTKQVEQSDSACVNAQQDAQNIITKLTAVAKMPVPTVCLKVEDEPSVKEFDRQIIDKEQEIQAAIDDKPTYKIPDMYRTVAQRDMSDEDYLSYLDSVKESVKPVEDDVVKIVKREGDKKEKVERVRLPKPKKKVASAFPFKKVVHIIGIILGNIVGWSISVFTLIFVLAALIQGGVASGIIFMVTALSINPLIYKLLKSKVKFIRVWMLILLYVATFIIGILVFPTSTPTAMAQVLM